MTTNPSATHERFERMRAERDEIDELIAKLYRVLTERHEPGLRVAHLMVSLKNCISGHFDSEEACEMIEPMWPFPAQKSECLAELRREHAQLVQQIDRLCRLADRSNDQAPRWEVLEQGFREFGTAMCHHEFREHEELCGLDA